MCILIIIIILTSLLFHCIFKVNRVKIIIKYYQRRIPTQHIIFWRLKDLNTSYNIATTGLRYTIDRYDITPRVQSIHIALYLCLITFLYISHIIIFFENNVLCPAPASEGAMGQAPYENIGPPSPTGLLHSIHAIIPLLCARSYTLWMHIMTLKCIRIVGG